jgi:hypothetical protein
MRTRMIAALIVAATPVLPAQRAAPASAPTPRLADGTPNLGRVPGESGVNGELAEYIRQENNQYLIRLTDDFGHPLFGTKR